MKALIYGAGSLGIVLGAYLAKGGADITLCNRNPAQVAALQEKGAQVTGTVEMTVPVQAVLPGDIQDRYDVIFLMTKQLDNAANCAFLKDKLTKQGVIVTLQNGMPEMGVAEVIGPERTLGCAVAWGATLEGNGVSRLTSEPDSLTMSLGRMPGVPDETLAAVKGLLELMCPVEVEENFMGARMSKLLINAAFSGMSAVIGGTFGEAAGNKASRRVVQALIKECIDMSRAAGIRMAPVQGKDIAALLDYHGPVKKLISFLVIPIAIKKHAALKASMLQDLEKGKRTEVDAINGQVCRLGKAHGVATPYNDTVVRLIHEMETGKRHPGMENLTAF